MTVDQPVGFFSKYGHLTKNLMEPLEMFGKEKGGAWHVGFIVFKK